MKRDLLNIHLNRLKQLWQGAPGPWGGYPGTLPGYFTRRDMKRNLIESPGARLVSRSLGKATNVAINYA